MEMKDTWCTCKNMGTCLGCMIEKKIKECYGTQGLAFLLGHVIGEKDNRPICPDCKTVMVKTHIELEDGSGWFTGWGCECIYEPKPEG